MESPRQHTGVVTLVLVGATFLAGLDLFIVNVAFDEIGRDFASDGVPPTLGALSWILNGYAVIFAALLVPFGRLTDRYGRKSGFVAGLAVFTLASFACGFADGVGFLVAARVLQAAGAAAMTPASLGLLLAALAPERRASGARLWAMTSALAAALGPAAGGGLVELSWRWAFWINVPIGAALVIAAIRFVPDVRHNHDAPRPDLRGAALLALAVGSLVLGLVQGNDWGWISARVLGSFAVTVLTLVTFARISATHAAPIIDPALLKVRAFRWANVAALVFNTGFGASLLLGILWMQQVWDYSALRTGLAIALGPLAVPVTALLAAKRLPRVPAAYLITAGTTLFAVASVWQAVVLSSTPAYASTFLPGWILGGIGVGLAMPNLVAAATASLPPAQAATGSGVASMARQVGLALGVAMLVGILGSGALDAERARLGWIFIAATSMLAALAALAIEPRTAAKVVPQPTS